MKNMPKKNSWRRKIKLNEKWTRNVIAFRFLQFFFSLVFDFNSLNSLTSNEWLMIWQENIYFYWSQCVTSNSASMINETFPSFASMKWLCVTSWFKINDEDDETRHVESISVAWPPLLTFRDRFRGGGVGDDHFFYRLQTFS